MQATLRTVSTNVDAERNGVARTESTDPVQDARDRLARYLAAAPRGTYSSDAPLKRLTKRLIPLSLRNEVQRRLTDMVRVQSRATARRLARRRPLQLHLGSATTPREGWVNIDMFGHPVDLAWNLNHPLPFSGGTVDAIFHEYVLTCFPPREALNLITDSYRLLRPGGILRISVADPEQYVRAWLERDAAFLGEVSPGRPTPLIAILDVFYSYTNRWMYDFESIALLCNAAGFTRVEQRTFGDSRIVPCPDGEHRRRGSLIVEAIK
jgi:predicted SAM-dependent methyltransferase